MQQAYPYRMACLLPLSELPAPSSQLKAMGKQVRGPRLPTTDSASKSHENPLSWLFSIVMI